MLLSGLNLWSLLLISSVLGDAAVDRRKEFALEGKVNSKFVGLLLIKWTF